jgi:hypothetical protein
MRNGLRLGATAFVCALLTPLISATAEEQATNPEALEPPVQMAAASETEDTVEDSESATDSDSKWRFRDGRWRVELQGVPALDNGKADREGDWYTSANVEYEWPMLHRWTMGLRGYPLFLFYERNDTNGDNQWIYGIGAGLMLRAYQDAETRTGWFLELGASALGLTDKFEDNGSNLVFLTQAGVGYKAPTAPWHSTLSVQHISNAHISSDNAGVNGVSVGLGYTF